MADPVKIRGPGFLLDFSWIPWIFTGFSLDFHWIFNGGNDSSCPSIFPEVRKDLPKRYIYKKNKQNKTKQKKKKKKKKEIRNKKNRSHQ